MNKNYIYYAAGILAGGLLVYFLSRKVVEKIDLSIFDSPDEPMSGNKMDRLFLQMLQKAEKLAGVNFNYSSAYRTPNYNQKVGGVPNSAHTKGMAVDIKTKSIIERDRIVWAAKMAGFNRIGIGSTFVHLDNDSTKPQNVAWGYPLGTPPPFNPFT